MVWTGNVFIGAGILGLLGSTIGAPLVVLCISFFKKQKAAPASLSSLQLDILIPAHNEETLICKTLASLVAEVQIAKSQNPSGRTVNICVGLDHCTDSTEECITTFNSQFSETVQLVKNINRSGKWQMLKTLVQQSTAEWVALVDAGSAWETNILTSVFSCLADSRIIGIAPSYCPLGAGALTKFSWAIEASLKLIESRGGGPVSVHGATVFYKREPLMQILEKLNPDENWLNDDVVIPLAIRTEWPELKIAYLARVSGAWVRDHGTKTKNSVESGRRKRMMLGNLQWIQTLYFHALASNFIVGIIASRRVFRTFWAYWILFLAIGISLHAAIYFSSLYLGLIFALVGAYFLYRIRAAFLAGLQIPFHWMNSNKIGEKVWN